VTNAKKWAAYVSLSISFLLICTFSFLFYKFLWPEWYADSNRVKYIIVSTCIFLISTILTSLMVY